MDADAKSRVLVVDDSRDTTRMMTLLLRHFTSETRAAHDGPEAIESALGFQPDVVLLDLRLPNLGGHEVARVLRSTPGLEHALLIAVTGEEPVELPAGSPFNHVLPKPLDFDALLQLMRRHEGRAGPPGPHLHGLD